MAGVGNRQPNNPNGLNSSSGLYGQANMSPYKLGSN